MVRIIFLFAPFPAKSLNSEIKKSRIETSLSPSNRPPLPPAVRPVLPAEYGVYALAGSILLTMMGISLMFEKNLIRLGNVSRS